MLIIWWLERLFMHDDFVVLRLKILDLDVVVDASFSRHLSIHDNLDILFKMLGIKKDSNETLVYCEITKQYLNTQILIKQMSLNDFVFLTIF